MNVVRYNNKCVKGVNRSVPHNRLNVMKNKCKPQRQTILCNNNNKDNIDKYNNISTEQQQINSSDSIDKGLFVFTTFVFSSIMVLCTCFVMILCARETSLEAHNLYEKYNKLYEEVKHLEEKNMDDEMMINTIVSEIVELKNIGII